MADNINNESDCGRNPFYHPKNKKEEELQKAAIIDNEYYCFGCGCVPDENGKCGCVGKTIIKFQGGEIVVYL